MTTPLVITRIWPGETVAVLGNSPSLEMEMASLPRPIHAIACNQAAIKAPWADMMVSIDANWAAAADNYAGMRIIGFEADIDAYYVNMPHELVTLAPGHILHIRSNLLAAIRIAAAAGAARILLLGIDPEYYEANLNAPGTTAGLAALVEEMRVAGVAVERYVISAESPVAAPAEIIPREHEVLDFNE